MPSLPLEEKPRTYSPKYACSPKGCRLLVPCHKLGHPAFQENLKEEPLDKLGPAQGRFRVSQTLFWSSAGFGALYLGSVLVPPGGYERPMQAHACLGVSVLRAVMIRTKRVCAQHGGEGLGTGLSDVEYKRLF